MTFADVIGQQAVAARLTELVQQNRLSHAMLFHSREGAGALPLALAFSQYLVCEKVRNASSGGASLFGDEIPTVLPPDACGVCPACTKAQLLSHPDIHFSYPVIPKKSGDKPVSTQYAAEWREFVRQIPYGNVFDWLQSIGAENKQGNITAEECNDINRKLSLKSFESKYKILVLWMAEYLGKEGNKLLKLIEEPPPDTVFILIAENEDQILPTILSRCQHIRIPSPDNAAIAAALRTLAGASEDVSEQIAAVVEGNYHEALQQLQHADTDWQAMVRDWLNAALRGGPAAQVKWVEEISKTGREKQKQFLRYCTHLLEQSIRLRIIGAERFAIRGSESDFAVRLNKIASVSQQQVLIQEMEKAAYHVERNANPRMLFHALTIRLYHIISHKALILTD